MIAQAAAAMGNGDVVMTLLKAGSLYGSALHFACAGGHAPIVQEIVEDGMRMDVRHNHPRKVEGEEVWHSSTSAASKDKGCTPRAPPPPPPRLATTLVFGFTHWQARPGSKLHTETGFGSKYGGEPDIQFPREHEACGLLSIHRPRTCCVV